MPILTADSRFQLLPEVVDVGFITTASALLALLATGVILVFDVAVRLQRGQGQWFSTPRLGAASTAGVLVGGFVGTVVFVYGLFAE